ncbi:hypothetical protein WICMUC_005715 [Wickerhamomyces mucosus]|uniref:UBA domain-containing protein n=1 Tax=Wickerhamomyces mucosus TaxID=1378264 RepID=A0A9P8T5W1_9ASCO|nr:hypothetical protein WICMUC_005715 [Wickerhamomyces mucosus]
MDSSKISQLTDMGIAESDAIAALEYTQGNVEQALDFIFNPPQLPTSDYGQNKENQYTEIEQGILDQIPPPLPSRETIKNDDYIRGINNDDFIVAEDEDEDEDDDEEEDEDEDEEVAEKEYHYYSVYNDTSRFKSLNRETPSVLMPINNGYLESYLNSIISILYEIPEIKKLILSYQFKDYGYSKNWFKGELIQLDVGDSQVFQKGQTGIKEHHDLRFLLELQRIFVFLDNKQSSRGFASVKALIKTLPVEMFSNSDQITEVLSDFLNILKSQIALSNNLKGLDIFNNITIDITDERERDFAVFHFDFEDIKDDIYKTLNSLLWSENLYQSMKKFSSTLFFTIEPSDGYIRNAKRGFVLDEEIFPEIYHVDNLDLVNKLYDEYEKLVEKRHIINKERMKFKSFEGKDVSNFLSTSVNFLKNEKLESLENELKSIKDHADDKKDQFIKEIEEIEEKLAIFNPNNTETLLTRLKEKKRDNLTTYLLTGVIFSPSIFVNLKKINNELRWFSTKFENSANFDVQEVSLEEITQEFYKVSKGHQLGSAMLLVYTEEQKFMEDVSIEYNDGLKEFIKKDEEELNKLQDQELIDLSDSIEIELSEEKNLSGSLIELNNVEQSNQSDSLDIDKDNLIPQDVKDEIELTTIADDFNSIEEIPGTEKE